MMNMSTSYFGNFTNTTSYLSCSVDHPPLNSTYFQSVVYLMYAIIFVVGTIGNGIVCYIVMSTSRMRTVTNYFIMNLAVGDLLMTVLCVPFTSVSYLKQYWPFGVTLCPVVNYSQAFAVFVSSYTLVAISVDRYVAIMWPLKPRMSKRIAALVIFTVWLVSAITVLPIAMFSELSQPEQERFLRCDL